MRKLRLLKQRLNRWSEKMDTTKIDELSIQLQSLAGCDATRPFSSNVVLNLREEITSVAQQILGINLPISNHLLDLKNTLFTEIPYRGFYINLTVYGQTIEVVEFVKCQILGVNQAGDKGLCHLLHPDIQRVSEKLYRDGSYAEAACNAFIEINDCVKKLYQTLCPDDTNPPDGQALMNKAFADKEPVIEAADRSTQTGRDIHTGTRFLFAGAMAALRNPKSHKNIELEKEDCMRRLIFASMLMFRIDEIVAASENNS